MCVLFDDSALLAKKYVTKLHKNVIFLQFAVKIFFMRIFSQTGDFMNRIFRFFLTFSLFALPICANAWTNYAGFSLNVPFLQTEIDEKNTENDGEKINELSFGGELTYIGAADVGFVVKADAAVGAATSDEIEIQGSGRNVGFYELFSLGIGYAFVNTEKMLFGAAAMGGIQISQYSHEREEDVSDVSHSYTDSLSLVTGSVGADIFLVYNFGSHFGIFANAGARYIYAGAGQNETKDEWNDDGVKKSSTSTNDFDLTGKFLVVPSVGIIWHF